MVQPTNQRELYDAPRLRRLHRTLFRPVLAERQMGAAGMIVLVDEPPKQSSQMLLVHHDDVIQQLATQGPDRALHVWRLPGRAPACLAARQQHPEAPVDVAEPWSFDRASEHAKLVP